MLHTALTLGGVGLLVGLLAGILTYRNTQPSPRERDLKRRLEQAYQLERRRRWPRRSEDSRIR